MIPVLSRPEQSEVQPKRCLPERHHEHAIEVRGGKLLTCSHCMAYLGFRETIQPEERTQ
jgi:hypothetical protein